METPRMAQACRILIESRQTAKRKKLIRRITPDDGGAFGLKDDVVSNSCSNYAPPREPHFHAHFRARVNAASENLDARLRTFGSRSGDAQG
jgi:hypothetical protein